MVFARLWITNAIQTVDDSTNLKTTNLSEYPLFKVENAEGGKTAVYLKQLAYVLDDNLAIDNLQAIEWWQRARWGGNLKELLFNSLVYGALDGNLFLKQLLEHHR